MKSSTFLVTTPIPEPGMSILAEAGKVVSPAVCPTPDLLREHCSSGAFDILVSQLSDRLDAPLLKSAKIWGISNYAVGVNNIDIPAATMRSIMVANTPGILTDATADITMLLILGAARRVVESDQFLRAGKFTGWQPDLLLGRDVSGATLGLAGFGRIAMRVIFCPRPPGDRPVSEEELGELSGRVQQVTWQELVRSSDYLSLHVPMTTDTQHLVDAKVLETMKDTAVLINTARGPIVDESALVHALQMGQIASAGIDVYENEPRLEPGLAELANTVLLPHLGSATSPVRSEMARVCAENAVAMARGRVPPHPVNPEAWSAGSCCPNSFRGYTAPQPAALSSD
jgi:glyoxylate reductase